MTDEHPPAHEATPSATLEQQIMDPCIPKSEREWWAAREIERLRDALAHFATDETPEGWIAIAALGGKSPLNTKYCYECDKEVNYLFPDGRGSCCTRIGPDNI